MATSDGRLTDAEIVRLRTLLVSDPSVADALALACELATFLDEHFHEAAAARSEAESLIASVSFEDGLEEDLAAKDPAARQALTASADNASAKCTAGSLAGARLFGRRRWTT